MGVILIQSASERKWKMLPKQGDGGEAQSTSCAFAGSWSGEKRNGLSVATAREWLENGPGPYCFVGFSLISRG
jgi:hypothetical protein